jgi:parvulin-like peptidyl-prolyl isomerase|tara:strand:- start:33 stop:971 length:939 start_codon:yes stop_codon:yes gene_type:complete
MKNILFIGLIVFFIFFKNSEIQTQINNRIVAKVGGEIITAVDLESEIKIILILSKKEFNQENIDKTKNIAVKTLVKKLIKINEINKFKITDYDKKELRNYEARLAKSINQNIKGLREVLKTNNINYETFIERIKTELLWNSLIFKLYRGQIEINNIEIENLLRKRVDLESKINEYKLSEIEIFNDEKVTNAYVKNIYDSIKIDGFSKTAKQISISESSSNNGELGWVPEEALSQKYVLELKKMNIGDITKPISNEGSLVILKILDIKVSRNENVDIDKLKKQLVIQKKEEKLELFSRSHYSDVENSTLISFE